MYFILDNRDQVRLILELFFRKNNPGILLSIGPLTCSRIAEKAKHCFKLEFFKKLILSELNADEYTYGNTHDSEITFLQHIIPEKAIISAAPNAAPFPFT